MTRRREGARRDGGESLRRQAGVGKASTNNRDASGATPARTTLVRPGADQPESPRMGVLRPLARALMDLAVALEREDEEDEPWTR